MTNPKFAFCGYPVQKMEGASSTMPQHWIPCGAIATPGCAYCDAHANAVVDDLPLRTTRSGVADTLALDTGNGRTPPLTADDIVDRAERRARRWEIIGELCRINLLIILVAVALLFEPLHAWLNGYRSLLCGIVLGALIEGTVWGVWRWRKGDRP